MALTNAQLLADQKRVFSDFPTEDVVISGNTYNGLVMDQRRGSDFGEGGEVPIYNLRIAIERSAIDGSIPTRGTTATYASGTYRIADVEQDDANASVVLTLENLTLM